MLPNAEDKRILHVLDHNERLALAVSASILLALDRQLCPDAAVNLVCKVFAQVFPEKAAAKAKKSG